MKNTAYCVILLVKEACIPALVKEKLIFHGPVSRQVYLCLSDEYPMSPYAVLPTPQ